MRCRNSVQSEDGSSALNLLLCLAWDSRGKMHLSAIIPFQFCCRLIWFKTSNWMKHIWNFKGSVNKNGKILKEFICSFFWTGHSQIFCMLLRKEKVPQLYVIAENTAYRRQYFPVTVYLYQISVHWHYTLILGILCFWVSRVWENNSVQNNDIMLLGRIT